MVINNIHDLATYLGTSADRLERDIYKFTDCGAWIHWDSSTVSIGSIVEGSDAEFSNTFCFPFSSDAYEDWMTELEALTDEAWHEANDDDADGWDRWDLEPSRNDWDEEE